MSFLDALLGRKHASMIGLDISTSSVKLVELGQSASGEFVVERFASEPFEKGWITDGQIEKFDEVAEAVRRVVRLLRIAEYKRRQAPPGIRITKRAFGKDWRYPITNRFLA